MSEKIVTHSVKHKHVRQDEPSHVSCIYINDRLIIKTSRTTEIVLHRYALMIQGVSYTEFITWSTIDLTLRRYGVPQINPRPHPISPAF
jgi:hypothetical protein